jgi:opacity protein-like surface antigen
MNGRKSFLVAAALLAFAFPAAGTAQTLYISGGATFPTGDYGDYADTGWMLAGGVLFSDIGTAGLSLGADGFYGQNSHNDYDGDKTNLYGAMGIVQYNIGSGNLQPYVWGGAGWLAHKYSGDEFPEDEGTDSSFGYQLGAGIGYGLSENVSIYGEGRYMAGTGDNKDTKLLGVFGGLAFAI